MMLANFCYNSYMEINTILFFIVSALVTIILIAVLVILIYVIKIIKDFREVSSITKEVINEIEQKGLVPFLENSKLKKDLIQKLIEKAPKILPIVSSFIVHSILKKAKKKIINKIK